jgi:hypothetical protein
MTKRANFAAPIGKRVAPAPGKGNKPKALKMPSTLIGMDIVTALRDPNLLSYSIKDLTTYQTWRRTAYHQHHAHGQARIRGRNV